MNVRETSRSSYKKINNLGAQQQLVFDAIKLLEPCTDREVSKHLDLQITQVTGRRHELIQYGFVVEHGKKYDAETRRNVLTWATDNPLANHQTKKAVGKPVQKSERKSVKKYTLRLKNGKLFTISEAMKDEIEAASKAKRSSNESITIANHVFAIGNIAFPIQEQRVDEQLETMKKEQTREVILVQSGEEWLQSEVGSSKLRREQVAFRTQRIGVETGRIHSDMMTYFEDGYETMRDMKGES